jgi:hypothetical protein
LHIGCPNACLYSIYRNNFLQTFIDLPVGGYINRPGIRPLFLDKLISCLFPRMISKLTRQTATTFRQTGKSDRQQIAGPIHPLPADMPAVCSMSSWTAHREDNGGSRQADQCRGVGHLGILPSRLLGLFKYCLISSNRLLATL